ncbi:MAG: hypothetical protein M3R71_01850 [Actinomycetota bacterium]|nr:hypothetical protein [Actinomycetota bacterium]
MTKTHVEGQRGAEDALEAVLDVVFFAPLGFLLSLGDEIPRLAAKGRLRLTPQLMTARVVGEFAVKQGRQELGRWVDRRGTPSRPVGAKDPVIAPPGPLRPTDSVVDGHLDDTESELSGLVSMTPPVPAPEPVTAVMAAGPSAATLGIPGYDSLSASQVVQRLAGLSAPELDAVRRYEAAGRGRRTILTRISQLQVR